MTAPKNALPALTAAIARTLDLAAVRDFDGHIIIDNANGTKGTIAGRVLHAHDQAEVLKFSLALAL